MGEKTHITVAYLPQITRAQDALGYEVETWEGDFTADTSPNLSPRIRERLRTGAGAEPILSGVPSNLTSLILPIMSSAPPRRDGSFGVDVMAAKLREPRCDDDNIDHTSADFESAKVVPRPLPQISRLQDALKPDRWKDRHFVGEPSLRREDAPPLAEESDRMAEAREALETNDGFRRLVESTEVEIALGLHPCELDPIGDLDAEALREVTNG